MLWARSSVGEHYVDIVGVASSILAAPTATSLYFLSLPKPDGIDLLISGYMDMPYSDGNPVVIQHLLALCQSHV